MQRHHCVVFKVREVTRLATILKNGQSLPDNAESQSLTTLVQTGFHTILNLVKVGGGKDWQNYLEPIF